MRRTRVFITYAREDEGYVEWVKRLARTLRDRGFEPRLDELHVAGRDLTAFMNAEIRQADRVLVLGSPGYKRKVEAAEEGVADTGAGHESALLAAFAREKGRAAVVLGWTRGAREDSLPFAYLDRLAVDLREPHAVAIDELARLLGDPAVDLLVPDALDDVDPLVGDSGFPFALDLRAWIETRWPSDRRALIHPTWEELRAGEVHLPGAAVAEIEAHLESAGVALVLGHSAAGKSVLGIGFAVRWLREVGRRCLVLDLAEHEGLQPHEVRADLRRFITLRGETLLVIDNAQIMPSVVQWLLDRLNRSRSGHRVLILSRPLADKGAHRAGLAERLENLTVHLQPDGASFAGLATRIARREGVAPPWTELQSASWPDEFGGDLIAFGQAVLHALPRRNPTPAMATDHIRRAYVAPVVDAPPYLAALDRLAAASLLELSLHDSVLDGAAGVYLRHLDDGGLVRWRVYRQHRFWHLMHPGLGHMISMVRARDRGVDLATHVVQSLLEAGRVNPIFVGDVSQRLARVGDSHLGVASRWFEALAADEELVCAWCFMNVKRVSTIEAQGRVSIPWRRLLSKAERPRLWPGLLKAPLDAVVAFLASAAHIVPRRVAALMTAMLTSDEVFERLVQAPAYAVRVFLRYAAYDNVRVRALVEALLAHPERRARLIAGGLLDAALLLELARGYDPAGVDGLLRWMVSRDELVARLQQEPRAGARLLRLVTTHLGDEAPAAIQILVRSGSEVVSRAVPRERSAPAPAQDARAFALARAFERASGEMLVAAMDRAEQEDPAGLAIEVAAWFSNGRIAERLVEMPLQSAMAFLRYVSSREPELAADVYAALFAHDDFLDRLAVTPANVVADFLARAEALVAHAVGPTLDRLLRHAGFLDRMVSTQFDLLVAFYRFAVRFDRPAVVAIIQALCVRVEFRERLRRERRSRSALFVQFASALGVAVSKRADSRGADAAAATADE